MKHECGIRLNHFPLIGLSRTRDLIWLDGPFLVEYRNATTGEPYLYLWCDQDEAANRWLVFRTTETTLRRYRQSAKTTLRDVLLQAPDQFVFVLDMDAAFTVRSVSFLPCADIPEGYLPSPDSLFDPDLLPPEAEPESFCGSTRRKKVRGLQSIASP